MRDGARAWNDDGFFRNDQGLGIAGCIDRLANEIVNRDGAIENRARAENGAALHDGSLINAGIPTEQDFVLDNHRQRSDRLENATNLRGCRDVAVAADLGATSNQSMRIDHRAFTNVSTDVYE